MPTTRSTLRLTHILLAAVIALFAGTSAINAADAAAKGRNAPSSLHKGKPPAVKKSGKPRSKPKRLAKSKVRNEGRFYISDARVEFGGCNNWKRFGTTWVLDCLYRHYEAMGMLMLNQWDQYYWNGWRAVYWRTLDCVPFGQCHLR